MASIQRTDDSAELPRVYPRKKGLAFLVSSLVGPAAGTRLLDTQCSYDAWTYSRARGKTRRANSHKRAA